MIYVILFVIYGFPKDFWVRFDYRAILVLNDVPSSQTLLHILPY